MGKNYSLVVPGFGGKGNDLRLVLGPEAAKEVAADIQKILAADGAPIPAQPNPVQG